MEWVSTKIRFPKAGKKVLTACKNKNMEDGIWLYDLCYYYPDTGWEGRINWEDVLYWTYIDKPKLVMKLIDKLKRKYLHWKWQKRWNKAWSISCHKACDFYNEYIDACSPWYYFWNELNGLKNK